MITGVFGWGISGDDFVGVVMAVLMMAYLVYVLIKPERL